MPAQSGNASPPRFGAGPGSLAECRFPLRNRRQLLCSIILILNRFRRLPALSPSSSLYYPLLFLSVLFSPPAYQLQKSFGNQTVANLLRPPIAGNRPPQARQETRSPASRPQDVNQAEPRDKPFVELLEDTSMLAISFNSGASVPVLEFDMAVSILDYQCPLFRELLALSRIFLPARSNTSFSGAWSS